MVNVNVKWGKNSYDVDINVEEPVAVFKTQLWTLTGVPVERQKIMGVKGGLLKDDANWAALGIKDGQKLQLVGTAEGGELKGPAEKVVFMEDLSAAEKAKLLKEKLKEPMPFGLVNLGNTCYMNAVVQFLKPAKDFTAALARHPGTAGSTSDPDGKVTASFKEVYRMLENAGEAVPPFGAVQYLRERFPQFAQRARSGQGFAQQDAEEVLNCLMMTFATQLKDANGKSAIDKLFGFNIKAKYKCIESEAEGEEEKEETARKLCCFLGNQLQPVDHLHQGIKLGLEETIEKNSSSLGRMAHYAKVGRIDSLPDYMVVHFVRFEWKKAHELARTEAGKTKMCRKVSFPQKMDIYEFCTESLKKKLRVARIVQAERAEREASLRNDDKNKKKEGQEKKDDEDKDVAMTDATPAAGGATDTKTDGDKMEVDAQGAAPSPYGFKAGEPLDNGQFELVSIVTHQGRAADSGHYIGWSKKSDDEWLKFDDDKVSEVKWAQIQELQGGLFDFHIAYLLLFKKLTVTPTAEELKEAESGHVKPSVVLAAEGSAANNPSGAGSSKDGVQL